MHVALRQALRNVWGYRMIPEGYATFKTMLQSRTVCNRVLRHCPLFESANQPVLHYSHLEQYHQIPGSHMV